MWQRRLPWPANPNPSPNLTLTRTRTLTLTLSLTRLPWLAPIIGGVGVDALARCMICTYFLNEGLTVMQTNPQARVRVRSPNPIPNTRPLTLTLTLTLALTLTLSRTLTRTLQPGWARRTGRTWWATWRAEGPRGSTSPTSDCRASDCRHHQHLRPLTSALRRWPTVVRRLCALRYARGSPSPLVRPSSI